MFNEKSRRRFRIAGRRIVYLAAVIYLLMLYNQISSMRSDISSIQGDVGSIQSDVSSIQSDVSSIESGVSGIGDGSCANSRLCP